jgi:hypothetical protein
MKPKLLYLVLALFGVLSVYLLWTVSDLQYSLKQTEQKLEALQKEASEDPQEGEEHYELAVAMGRFQWYANKLWFSGIAGNTELSDFYAHELEEAMEEVAEQNLTENGQSISEQIKIWGLEPLEKLEEAVADGDSQAFEQSYDALVSSCNGCHVTCGYSWVRIKRPETPAFDNQWYTKN